MAAGSWIETAVPGRSPVCREQRIGLRRRRPLKWKRTAWSSSPFSGAQGSARESVEGRRARNSGRRARHRPLHRRRRPARLLRSERAGRLERRRHGSQDGQGSDRARTWRDRGTPTHDGAHSKLASENGRGPEDDPYQGAGGEAGHAGDRPRRRRRRAGATVDGQPRLLDDPQGGAQPRFPRGARQLRSRVAQTEALSRSRRAGRPFPGASRLPSGSSTRATRSSAVWFAARF